LKLSAEPESSRLQALVARGIGLRRHEGFGHLQATPTLAMTPKQQAAVVAEAQERARNRAAKAEQMAISYASLRSYPEVLSLVKSAVGDPAAASAAREAATNSGDQFGALPRQVDRLLGLSQEEMQQVIKALEAT